jgi:hypothetical protein
MSFPNTTKNTNTKREGGDHGAQKRPTQRATLRRKQEGAAITPRFHGRPAHYLKNRALDANKYTKRVTLSPKSKNYMS